MSTDHFRSLQHLIPPPAILTDAGSLRARSMVERALGVKLPRDIFHFGKIYGTGWFGIPEFRYLLQVANPFSPNFLARVTDWSSTFQNLKNAEGSEFFPYDLYPTNPGLLPIGYGDNRRHIFWLTEGAPDDWPILVWPPERKFIRINKALPEFLLGLFSGEITCWGAENDAKWFKSHKNRFTFEPDPPLRDCS